jgi:hypothetical protein
LYTAKCYWPNASEVGIRAALASTSAHAGRETGAEFQGALYLSGDDLVLCLFEAQTPGAVRLASERARLPCERVIECIWLTAGLDEGGIS